MKSSNHTNGQGDRQGDGQAIAVVGMGVALPGASSPEEMWHLLNEPVVTFTEPGGRYRNESFWNGDPSAEDSTYVRTSGFIGERAFRPHPRVAEELRSGRLRPGQHSLIWLRHCLAQATSEVRLRDDDRCAFYLGSAGAGSQQDEETALVEAVAHGVAAAQANGTSTASGEPRGAQDRREQVRRRLRAHYVSAATRPADILPDRLAQHVAADLLPGVHEFASVDAACASALQAIDLGVHSLLSGDTSVACCGSFFSVGPRFNVLFSKLSGLSPTGDVQVFDASANGTLFSDGATMVVLKRLDRARADKDPVLGIVAGSGSSSDGAGKAIYAPNPRGQRLCLERARRASALGPEDIDWVIAHGTGTVNGDLTELSVLEENAPENGYLATSGKSVVGHAAWASGGVSFIHALLALKHGRIPAQHRFTVPSETAGESTHVRIPRASVPFRRRSGRPRTVGVSAIGFGGINSHMILQGAEAQPRTPHDGNTGRHQPLAVVAWTALLPGEPDPDGIRSVLAHGPEERHRRFPDPLTPPSFAESRLPPYALRNIDRGQQLLLRTAAKFVAEHGELWGPVRDTTGVITAQTGPSRLFMDSAVRCYARDLALHGDPADAEAMRLFLDRVRHSAPASAAGTLTGIQPNVLGARIASRYDLHGLTSNVDAADGAGDMALHVASRHLCGGRLDMALVAGLNANSGPDFAAAVERSPHHIAEGCFLVALAREPVAEEHGWPVIGRLTVGTDGLRDTSDEASPPRLPEPDGWPTYLGGDGIARVIEALELAGEPPTRTPPSRFTPRVRIEPAGISEPVSLTH
ncbi:beta-ketoacyl synthase N-terminal-like domain-containing protein [Streptomyces daliensis]|uniref:Beta-ketoacyl synthase n=1 Tax=Streptomyces daliensis TaxID=299421 RepID=A0A8T4IS97_9ACTN|nr:beta-ketoacyl synthase [Streptomyces daliensis]